MWKIYFYVWRGVLIVAAGAGAWWLASRFGVWEGLGVWAGVMGVGCVLAAVLMRTSPMGRVTWRNRFAGYFLPWGYRLGRGKLMGITVVAWGVWVVIGGAAIFLTGGAEFGRLEHPWAAILLFGLWMAYGGMILRQVGYVFNEFRLNPRGKRTMLMATALMLGLVGVSGWLWWGGMWWLAVGVAGWPAVLVGGGYGLFIGVILMAGKNMRWN